MGSVFFTGTEKTPLALSAFLVDSHQRFHSVSVKTSPTSHSLICCAVALPSKLSRILRARAAGFSPAKSITIWLSSRFHSLTRPNPQLLCKQNVPGFSCSSCCAAREVSLPASTSFSNSVSINEADESHVTYKSDGSGAQFTFAVCPGA